MGEIITVVFKQHILVTESFDLADHAGRVAEEMARICDAGQYEDLAAAFRLAGAIAETHKRNPAQSADPE